MHLTELSSFNKFLINNDPREPGARLVPLGPPASAGRMFFQLFWFDHVSPLVSDKRDQNMTSKIEPISIENAFAVVKDFVKCLKG